MTKSKAGMVTIPLGEAVDEVMEAEQEGARGYIGCSMIASECERALWYDFRWALAPEFPGRVQRRFKTGHEMELRVIERLKQIGLTVHHENPRARNPGKQYGGEYYGGLLAGHLDGFAKGKAISEKFKIDLGDKWHLLEVKAMASAKYRYLNPKEYDVPIANKHPIKDSNSKKSPKAETNIVGRFWETKKKGCKNAQKTHYGQMQAYMGLSHEKHPNGKPYWQMWGLDAPLTRGLYIAVNTDTEQYHAELIEYEPKWWSAAKARAIRLIRATEPPERFKDTPAYPPCSFCSYVGICHGQDRMEVNCRSCKHSRIKVPGDHGFFSKRGQFICDANKSGCADFEACSKYEPITETLTF